MTDSAPENPSESIEGRVTSSSGQGDSSARPLPVGKRKVRRRVALPPWVLVWRFFSVGPPAQIAQSLVQLLRPEETFSNSRGPWHRGLVVARERRFRKRQSAVVRYARYGAPAEVAQLIGQRARRHPIAWALGVALVIWWFMPWWRPPVPPVISAQDSHPLVVAVDGTTWRRVRAALSAWRAMPGARLVVMDVMDVQGYAVLKNAALTPEETRRVTLVRTCGDTITLSADMAKFLQRIPGAPGQAIFVTSPDTMERLMAIMQIMLGADGWRMEGLPSETPENPPESPFRRWRDQLRAQFWRATGISGKNLFVCKARGMGLI